MVPEIWKVTEIFLSFWIIFLSFYPRKNPKNQNFEQIKKNLWRYHHFTLMHQKLLSYAALVLVEPY